MTTYTGITNAQVDVDSPVTQTLMTLLRDNPISVFEGDSTAPRIAEKWAMGLGGLNTATDFINLSGWPAFIFQFKTYRGISAGNVTLALSDDNGSTFATASTLYSNTGNTGYEAVMHLDRVTGAYSGIAAAGGAPFTVSGTLAGASSSVDAVRFYLQDGYVGVYLRGIGEDTTV